jgi:hypothetical protein
MSEDFLWNHLMSTPQDESAEPSPPAALHRPDRTLWQRLGGEGLALSILVHGILVVIAVIWVVSTVTDTSGKKDPNTFATGSGGGSGGPKAKEYKTKLQPKNVKSLTKTNSRITSKNANASMAISSMPSLANPLATAGAIGGGSSKGFGGGSGGGIGGGKGAGVGGGRNFVSLFGMKSTGMTTGGLIGTLYDLKQTSDRKPTAAAPAKVGIPPYRASVREFLESGWSPGRLQKFFKSPDMLVSGQIFITGRSADDAPRAFEVEKLMKPSRWVVHYRCYVEAPNSLPFRFVGSGDDFLIVRWNRKIALDDGYETFFTGRDGNYKDFGVKVSKEYKVDRRPGGLHRLKAGPWIQVTKGTKVPVEVLMGETPGGVFDSYLAIEVAKSGTKVDGQYEGEGKLKLFRCSTEPVPAEVTKDKRGLNIDMEAAGWIFKVTKDSNTVLR